MSQIPDGWVKKIVDGKETYSPPSSNRVVDDVIARLMIHDIKKTGMVAASFVVNISPMGAPRMTQRDVWKKRPVVLRYHAFRDALRAAVGKIGGVPDRVDCEFYFAMPESWSEKKKKAMDGKPHRSKPDRDNCDKAVCDALFAEDSAIHEGSQKKRWCRAGQERVEIKLTTYKI